MKEKKLISSQQGFSLTECLIVLAILGIFATFSILGTSSKRLFAADDQALQITDILQEARQRALTEGKTMRVELDDTKKQIRLIDEKGTTNPADDVVIRTSSFNPATTVGNKPATVDSVSSPLPPSSSPAPEIQYKQTNYPLSANDKVQTLRFDKTGEVLDAGTDNLGTGAIITGATIYVYNGASGSSSNVVRAITLSGVTAASQLYRCQINNQGICGSWTK